MVATDGNSIRLVESLIKAKVNVNRQDNVIVLLYFSCINHLFLLLDRMVKQLS